MALDPEQYLFDKILGCLAMVAIGDALGMPAHDMTSAEIKRKFSGPLSEFRAPFAGSRVHDGFAAGQITDDTLLTLSVARAYIENQGALSPSLIGKYTAETVTACMERGLGAMFGASTRQAVQAIRAGANPVERCLEEKQPMTGSTNGGAMKISPVGLVHPGDVEGAVKDAVTVCLPTHATQTAISAACAVAAGVCRAMAPGADVFTVVKAALAGAVRGEAVGRDVARTVPLPSVPERIRLAVSLALKAASPEEANERLANLIGTGLAAYESIPTAIGIFVACEGDPKRCVTAGANVGFDTDTIASMAGALSGALHGFKAVPGEWLRRVEEVNGLDLRTTAKELVKVAIGHGL